VSHASPFVQGESYRRFYDVIDFGAKGHGVTNDTHAIQSACAAASNSQGGGVVVFPPGTYNIDAQIDIWGDDVEIRGTQDSILQWVGGAAGAVLSFTGDRVRVSDLWIDGGRTGAGPYVGPKGLEIAGADCELVDVIVENALDGGIRAVDCSNLLIDKCRVRNIRGDSGDGIYLQTAENAIVSKCIVSDVTRICIAVEGTPADPSESVIVSECIVSDAHDAGGGQINAGIWCENTLSALVEKNTVSDINLIGGVGILLQSSVANGSMEASGNLIDTADVGIQTGQNAGAGTAYKIRGGFIRGCNYGIQVQSGETVTIDDVHFGAVVYISDVLGLIQVSLANSTINLENLVVRGCSKETNTYVAKSADLNIAVPSGKLVNLIVSDLVGEWAINSQGTFIKAVFDRVTLFPTTSADVPISASVVRAAGCTFQQCSSQVLTGQFLQYQATADESYDDCIFSDLTIRPVTTNQPTSQYKYKNCRFANCQIQHFSGILRMDDSLVSAIPANGFIRFGFSNQVFEFYLFDNKVESATGNAFTEKWAGGFVPTRSALVNNDIPDNTLEASGYSPTIFDPPKAWRTATATPVTVVRTDYGIFVNLAVAGAVAANLPANPVVGKPYIVKDAKGDAAVNNITITPAAGLIDGAATLVLILNYARAYLVYDGVGWSQMD
jgi:hypothetical protein